MYEINWVSIDQKKSPMASIKVVFFFLKLMFEVRNVRLEMCVIFHLCSVLFIHFFYKNNLKKLRQKEQ